jgi:hypothetical protein
MAAEEKALPLRNGEHKGRGGTAAKAVKTGAKARRRIRGILVRGWA